jgi:uncharacterized protein (TIGR00251 family)
MTAASKASDDESTLLPIRVVPRARRNEVGGERNDRLIVRTVVPALEGRANAAVCKLVAEHLGVPPSHVEVASGDRSRDKVLRIRA